MATDRKRKPDEIPRANYYPFDMMNVLEWKKKGKGVEIDGFIANPSPSVCYAVVCFGESDWQSFVSNGFGYCHMEMIERHDDQESAKTACCKHWLENRGKINKSAENTFLG